VLTLVYLSVVAALSVTGLVVFVGLRTHGNWVPQMSSAIRDDVLNAWWIVAFVPLGAILCVMFMCDLWLWAFGRSRALSWASLTRGFEPFEDLIERLRAFPALIAAARGGGSGTPPTASPERAIAEGADPADPSDVDPGLAIVALLAVAVLMLAAPIGAALAIAILAGLKPLVGFFIAVPSGIAAFLIMGLIGDLLRHRAPGLALGGAVVGFVMCFWYYPALANQLSPKEIFGSYRRVCPGAQLGLLGVGGRTSAYYAGGQPQTLSDPASAYQWLVGGGPQRRCLALRAEELPKLNQLWRERHEGPRTNLPVVDARSSQILLVASSLEPGEKNENPLSSFLLSEPPHPQRKLGVNMEDKLEVIGFDLSDDQGRMVEAVSPGKGYHFKTYYRVLGPVTTEWEGFIHIDGYHRRHNGDHKPMNGKYPMALWLPGDLLVDDHEFKLEPNFTPGTYEIYFGLFVGDTRLKVVSGPSDGENRINGGPLRVQ